MKICAAQTKPVKGDIQNNVENHMEFVEQALSMGSDFIVFPELSLTGYEPELSKKLAATPEDSRLDEFQKISNERGIVICAGLPTQSRSGTCISMILFQPGERRVTYSKRFLHPDEEKFFVPGKNIHGLRLNQTRIALSICYELSIPEHAEHACQQGSEMYIASVAKFRNGIQSAGKRLSEIAATYSMNVLMSNCVGHSDEGEYAGNTSVWNQKGILAGQLNDTDEGLLILDTETQTVFKKMLNT